MEQNNRSKIWSLVITLLLSVAIVMFLLYYNLSVQYPPKGMEKLAQLDQDSIYVDMMADVPLGGAQELESGENMATVNNEAEDGPAAANQGPDQPAQPQAEGDDREDAGQPSPVQPRTITSAAPSPMKVKETSKPVHRPKPGAAKREKPTSPTRVKAATATKTTGTAASSSQSRAIGQRMRNAFGKGGSNTGSGTGRSTASGAGGTSASGHGSLGSGLVGYTVAHWGRPHSRYEGTV
ncbi:MAG: hypothetical protein SPL53_00865, partial [Bacteroidales bacterium]|nr:hypothetical protein [Bacteroidales bacterium]